MKILWQYLSHHDVTLELLSSTHIAPIREGDAVFMELLIADGWHTGKLCSANRVRKLKHVHHHYKVDGLTRDEHEAVISRFEELLQIDH